MESNKRSWKCLSGNALKMIAIITMLIDHGSVILIENGMLNGPFNFDAEAIMASPTLLRWFQVDMILRMVGRVAFPIFCFLIVEGFLHTRSVQKYGQRLLLFALISEIPFDFALFGSAVYLGYQNVYFTLFLGLAAMEGIRRFQGSLFKQLAVAAVCCVAASLLKVDYGAFGVFFMVLLYWFREHPLKQTLWGCIAIMWEVTAPLAFIPIRLYNGTRGKWNLKYVFYAFYPVHLLILWAIAQVIL